MTVIRYMLMLVLAAPMPPAPTARAARLVCDRPVSAAARAELAELLAAGGDALRLVEQGSTLRLEAGDAVWAAHLADWAARHDLRLSGEDAPTVGPAEAVIAAETALRLPNLDPVAILPAGAAEAGALPAFIDGARQAAHPQGRAPERPFAPRGPPA